MARSSALKPYRVLKINYGAKIGIETIEPRINMASITPGSGGSLTSTTVEAQILELAIFITLGEANTSQNPSGLDYIQIDTTTDMTIASIAWSFPVAASAAVGGGHLYDGEEFLIGTTFTPGSGGTITALSTLGYWKKLIEHAQELEAPNQATNDRLTGTLNINTKTFSGNATIPIAPTINSGGTITLTAVEFL